MRSGGLTNGKKLAESQNCRAESEGQRLKFFGKLSFNCYCYFFVTVSRTVHNLINEFLSGIDFVWSDLKLKKLSIMERQGHHIFANLFSSKGSSEKAETSKEVFTTSSAQPHVLREKMKERKLTHGETVKATFRRFDWKRHGARWHYIFARCRPLTSQKP